MVLVCKDHGEYALLTVTSLTRSRFTRLDIGQPSQTLEVDLDMLSSDFYTIITSSSRQKQKYNTFFSNSQQTLNTYAHDICRLSTDIFHFPGSFEPRSVEIEIPVCQPPKFSHHTLCSSGTILGLAPRSSRSLSHLTASSLLEQLLQQKSIEHNIFSITVLDSETGILSLGETAAPQIEEIKIRNEVSLKYLNGIPLDEQRAEMEREIEGALRFAIPYGSTYEDHFKWTDVGKGAISGWHMTLMTGLWVNGIKIMRNQPVLFDINCPYILAPPMAAETFYHAIPGGRSVSSLLDVNDTEAMSFYAWPCLNKNDIEFEIAGWRFPLAKGVATHADDLHGPTGGKFSLGQINVQTEDQKASTGYCAGIVVETRIGEREEWSRAGMKDVWVLGEPFFRDMGLAFDMVEEKIGLRIF